MKKSGFIVLCGLLCSLHFSAWCDNNDTLSHYKAEFTKLNRDYVENPTNVETMLNLVTFYSDSANPMRNYAEAMRFMCAAESRYAALVASDDDYRELRKLIKKDINIPYIRQRKQELANKARQELSSGRDFSLVEIDSYEEAFAGDATTIRLIKHLRISQSLRIANETKNIDDCYGIITTYPGSSEAETADAMLAELGKQLFSSCKTEEEIDAVAARYDKSESIRHAALQRKAHLEYVRACKKNDADAYRNYIKAYPSGDDYLTAINRLDTLLAVEYARLKTPQDYVQFIDSNSTNPIAEKALEELRRRITEDHDVVAARLYLEHFPLDDSYNEIFRLFYEWHASEGNRQPIEAFANQYPDFPFKTAMQTDLSQSTNIDAFNLNRPYNAAEKENYASFIRMNTGKGIAFVALQRMMQPLTTQKKWKKAQQLLDEFALSFEVESKKEYEELKGLVNNVPDNRNTIAAMIVSSQDMMHPVLSTDGATLYYTTATERGNVIYYAQQAVVKKHTTWKAVGPVLFDNFDNTDATLYSFYDNGNKMVLGQHGDIMLAERKGTMWHVFETPTAPVNSCYNDEDGYMLPDGSGMLLTSDRPEGFNLQTSGANYHGDNAKATDIYFVARTETGWGDIVNLGQHINTGFAERSAVMSKDMKTMYFISDGRGGFGYGDIYMAQRKRCDSWTEWDTPMNLGRNANSGFDEASLSLTDNESRLVVASKRNGVRYGCYSVGTTHESTNGFYPFSLILGERAIERVCIMEIESQSTLLAKEDPKNDTPITVNCFNGKKYAVFCNNKNRYVPPFSIIGNQMIVPTGFSLEQLTSQQVQLDMPTMVFYESSDRLMPIAETTLDYIADYLEKEPTAVVSFAINVEGVDDVLCFKLSQKRAQTIKTFLIQKGIEGAQIITSNYGNLNYKTGVHPNTAVSLHFELR